MEKKKPYATTQRIGLIRKEESMSTRDAFVFDDVAIFGRSLNEYVNMFNLDLNSLKKKRILDCNGGPAAFACQAAPHGINVIACDPSYQYDAATLRSRIYKDAEGIEKKHEQSASLLYKQAPPVPERLKAMEIFLADFPAGKLSGRYITGKLPHLPFPNKHFDLVLSSNFLFIYSDKKSGGMMTSDKFDQKFHCDAVMELIRVCKGEVRIYPLQGPGITKEHSYLPAVIAECQSHGHDVKIVSAKQKDILGAEKFLQIAVNHA